MRRREAAEEMIMKLLERDAEHDGPGMGVLEMQNEQEEIELEPSRLHRLGNSVLKLVGAEPRPYKPVSYVGGYRVLARLETQGVVDRYWSDLDERYDEGLTGRIVRYRLSKPGKNTEA